MKIFGINKLATSQRATVEKASSYLGEIYETNDFSVVLNPEGVRPVFDLYPLPPLNKLGIGHISAILTDLDGTTSTTEPLCLSALAYMITESSKVDGKQTVQHLDPLLDYPNIIGNSTTKHVEYLLEKYGSFLRTDSMLFAFIRASLWTLQFSADPERKKEVIENLKSIECLKYIEHGAFYRYDNVRDLNSHSKHIFSKIDRKNIVIDKNIKVKLAVDIYYQRYHFILMLIQNGKNDGSSKFWKGTRPIEPMPGIGEFLALVSGCLGDEADRVYSDLNKRQIDRLRGLGEQFELAPVKVALVTSSLRYEADIVLSEVFHILRQDFLSWDISDKRKYKLAEKFADYKNFYDAIVTASDSNEIRLKPHRDLYSIALRKLNLPEDNIENCIGLEDSESGILALRASGITNAIGIPFHGTQGHNLSAATLVLTGGLTELVVNHHCLINNRLA